MADIDIDPFREHESRPEEPTDDCILVDLHSGPQGLQLPQEDHQLDLLNWNVSKKHHLEAV